MMQATPALLHEFVTVNAAESVSDLIRTNATNTGWPSSTIGDREEAEYIPKKLIEGGHDAFHLGPSHKRGNAIACLTGTDPKRDALLVGSHLDVVPLDPSEWSIHPLFSDVSNGYMRGRRAADVEIWLR